MRIKGLEELCISLEMPQTPLTSEFDLIMRQQTFLSLALETLPIFILAEELL